MVDLETLGTNPDTIVVSIGACFFDIETKQLGPTFYMALDIEDQLKKGRSITGSTLKWWMSQSDAVKKVFHEKSKPTSEVLNTLVYWIKQETNKKNLKPWGNGNTFDISILENMFNQYNIEVPFMYYNSMDLRTFRRFVANNEKVDKSEGTNHNALDDAKNQALFVIKHSNKEV
jgi:hypothetical protein